MGSASAMYTLAAIADLTERTRYESYLLEAVYDIVDRSIATSARDNLIYPPDGREPLVNTFFTINVNTGDWRPGFLKVGAPLVFVTTYKLLDMMMEWVLDRNGAVPARSHSFTQKFAALKRPVVFPSLIESRPWLRERLIALYKELSPLRGTIIHDRKFQANGGDLEVTLTKGINKGKTIILSSVVLKSFADVCVSMIRFLEGVWTMGQFQEKRIGGGLEGLAHLHGRPRMGQFPPRFVTVRVYVPDEDPIEIDLARIRSDILTKYPELDVLFGVRVIAVAKDGQSASAYLIDWDQLQNAGPRLQKTRADLANSMAPVPTGIDIMAAARDLGLLPPEPAAPSGD
jgi:hypothetical protein